MYAGAVREKDSKAGNEAARELCKFSSDVWANVYRARFRDLVRGCQEPESLRRLFGGVYCVDF